MGFGANATAIVSHGLRFSTGGFAERIISYGLVGIIAGFPELEPDLVLSHNNAVPCYETTGPNVVPVFEADEGEHHVPIRVLPAAAPNVVPIEFKSRAANVVPVRRYL